MIQGSGVISDFAGKAPVIGSYLKQILEKIGLGINDYTKIMNGGCACLKKARGRTGGIGKGLYLRPYGGGLHISLER